MFQEVYSQTQEENASKMHYFRVRIDEHVHCVK